MKSVTGVKFAEDLKLYTIDIVKNIYEIRKRDSSEVIDFFTKSIDRAICDLSENCLESRNFDCVDEEDYRNRILLSANRFINVINREYLVSKKIRRNLPNPDDRITAENFAIPKKKLK